MRILTITSGVRCRWRLCLLWLGLSVLAAQGSDFDTRETDTGWAEMGFFFEGKDFVPPPYELALTNGFMFINGRSLGNAAELRAHLRPSRKKERDGRKNNTPLDMLRKFLNQGNTLVAFPDAQPVLLERFTEGRALLKMFDPAVDHAEAVSNLRRAMGIDKSERLLALWPNDFVAPQNLLAHVRAELAFVEKQDRQRAQDRMARAQLEFATFPLAAAAMVLTALATGHLLSTASRNGLKAVIPCDSPELTVIISRSLGLILGMSAIDLIWTVLASRAGDLYELNPLTARFGDNPAGLASVKLFTTALATGIVYKLRRHRTAQLAAWWICLIVTLLTARWVTFSYLSPAN